ncbi:hypothetical protein [Corynebacterium sp. H78]|uniref:hypothetical protein n=1 Tax=Corynebacterium sp. H78 TaxID=3133417 RepID=UPI00309EC556
MTWWMTEPEDQFASAQNEGSDDADPIPPRYAENEPPEVPVELEALLDFSREAARSLDHVSSWRAVSTFARTFWLDDSASKDLAEDKRGEFFALRHAVADQLELVDEAEEARTQWLDWAIRTNRPAAAFHARSFGAFAEAEKFVDSHPGDLFSGARPTDHDVPQLTSLARDILDLELEDGSPLAYQYALSAAVAGASASLARRPDIAEALANWARTYAPKRAGDDDRRLLDAQLAHGRGELRKAAHICAEVAASPKSEPVTSTIEARQMLAFLSLEAEEESEAIRQLRPVVTVGLHHDLTVGTLRSARLLAALLNSNGQYDDAQSVSAEALRRAAGMPINPLSMDIQLIYARSLFDAGDDDGALRYAEPVAHWSTFTSDEERTDAAFTIAASAAGRSGDIEHAVSLFEQLADNARSLGDDNRASRALRQAARSVASVDLDQAEDLMIRARDLISDGWSIADWHDDLAFVYWMAGNEDLALGHVDTAAAGYLEAGDGEEAARALLTGVRCCVDRGQPDDARRYAARIEKLLPEPTWSGHPVLDALQEILNM